MNKYQEALDSIKYTVVDIAADGYHEPKTVEDFNYEQCLLMQELVDKATPRKPLLYSNDEGKDFWYCPTCQEYLGNDTEEDLCGDYCIWCGQKIDWGEEDE